MVNIMKAKPLKRDIGKGYVHCEVHEATHVEINRPCISKSVILPVITKGTRNNTPCWTWNGDVYKPTLRPSVSSSGYCYDEESDFKCHSWITDGNIQFLGDCSHDKAGTTEALLNVA